MEKGNIKIILLIIIGIGLIGLGLYFMNNWVLPLRDVPYLFN